MSRANLKRIAFCTAALLVSTTAAADDKAVRQAVESALSQRLLPAEQPLSEIRRFIDPRVAQLPQFEKRTDWERYSAELRDKILDEIVFRGEAARWRDAETKVEWLDTIEGLPGYRIRKLRYEALPGMWIPALLYEPAKLQGKVPAVLNVNGHDPLGKSAKDEQIRSINCAKRGMLALHPEWIGMGQLRTPGFAHGRMNQLDLCGTSGLAVFYLCLSRGIDLLCEHQHADSARVAVTGLSGGGWQTAWIAALDERVQVANPVAGYTGLRIAIAHGDMGDSEQAPSDFGTIADGMHLTALRAPRPTLLTYNAADECCFKAGHTLEPLLAAARPIYALFAAKHQLRSHINFQPGTHNYERENREAFYRIVDDVFFPESLAFSITEPPTESELRAAAELDVAMPSENLDFSQIAKRLAADLPRPPADGEKGSSVSPAKRRERLATLVKFHRYPVAATQSKSETIKGGTIRRWLLSLGNDWTIPVVEFEPRDKKPGPIQLFAADAGYGALAEPASAAVTTGHHVMVVDPFMIGQAQITGADPQVYFGIALASIGERPLGTQASQLAAVAAWAGARAKNDIELVTDGRRSGLAATIAAALAPEAIAAVKSSNALDSLKQLIDDNLAIEDAPELFPFGLLAEFDVAEMRTLGRAGK